MRMFYCVYRPAGSRRTSAVAFLAEGLEAARTRASKLGDVLRVVEVPEGGSLQMCGAAVCEASGKLAKY